MRIRIEPEKAKSVSFHDYSIKTSIQPEESLNEKPRALKFALESQLMSNWCWAAIAASIGNYYKTGETENWTQLKVAKALLGFDCSQYTENPDFSEKCQKIQLLDEALTVIGCFNHWSPGKPIFERIQIEIENLRPVCLRIQWRNGSGHYVCISGYNAYTDEIFVQDPLYGPSVNPFHSFPNEYRNSGGEWTGTFWTSKKDETHFSQEGANRDSGCNLFPHIFE